MPLSLNGSWASLFTISVFHKGSQMYTISDNIKMHPVQQTYSTINPKYANILKYLSDASKGFLYIFIHMHAIISSFEKAPKEDSQM